MKRKIALFLAVCCLAAALRELPFMDVRASEITESAEAVTEAGTEIQEETGTEAGGEAETETENETGTEAEEEAETETQEEDGTETQEEDGTEAEEEAETETQEETGTEETLEAISADLRGGETDRTGDLAELKIQLDELYILKTEGNNLSYTMITEDGNKIYDVSRSSYYDIGKVKFKISFAVLKAADGGRELREGDYFTYKIPDCFKLADGYKDGSITFSGLTIAKYEKIEENPDGERLKFTFTSTVNAEEKYDNIIGGMNLELDFQAASLLGKDKIVQFLPKQDGGREGIKIKLPEEPSVVNGITKSGKHNAGDNTITWTIKVGTEAESKGMLLNGLIIKDTIGEGQVYVPGSAGIINGPGTAAVTQTGNEISAVLQGEMIQAPCTLELKTAVTKEKIEEAKAAGDGRPAELTFSNKAAIEPPADEGIGIGGKTDADAEVKVTFGAELAKAGKQVDSNTIHWTIEVNNKTPGVHTYRGEVTDKLVKGLTYKEGSMTYTTDTVKDAAPAVYSEGNVSWQDHSLQVKGSSSGGQELTFYMKEDTSSKYIIEFDTTVEEDFTGETDADGNTVVKNKAAVTAQFPYWTGSGPEYVPWDYGIPDANCRFDSSMIEKKVKADAKTGILTWTVYPSTRTSVYDNAVITDVVETKQEYIRDSIQVTKKDGSPAGAGIVPNYKEAEKTLTVTIPKGAGKLGDYCITYKTKALDYFTENNIEKEYNNTAVLKIMDGAEVLDEQQAAASVKMANPFLAKSTEFEYIEDTGYFHYTITVNKNGMDLKNVTVTDDIADCVFTAEYPDGSGGVRVPSGNWEFVQEKCRIEKGGTADADKTVTVTGTTATAALGDISRQYTVHLYARLNADGRKLLTKDPAEADSLAGKRIYSVNTVKAYSDSMGGAGSPGYEVTSNSAEQKVYMDNTLAEKSAAAIDREKAEVTWRVVLNPNGGKLTDAAFYDQLPKTAKYKKETVKLYRAVYKNNKLEKGTEVPLSDSAVRCSVDKDKRYMTVDLPTPVTGALILEYQTAVVDTKQTSITNNITLKCGETTYGSSEGKVELSGGNWGTLSTAGKLEITKYDANAGTKIPLPGAEFTVYSDSACTDPIDVGETDAQGKLLFYGLEAGTGNEGTEFYCRETKAPSEGYVENTEIYKVLIHRGGTAKLEVENNRKEAEEAIKAEVVKQYAYQDVDGAQVTVTNKQSEFELYFYPYGKDNPTGGKKVSFNENADGEYTYSAAAAGTLTTLKNRITDGKIIFTGLPWGYYGLKETKAAPGFRAYNGMKYFEIGFSEADTTGSFSVDYYFKEGDLADHTITNESTSFYVKKLLKDTNDYLADVKLQICRKSGASLTVVENPLTNERYEWITKEAEKTDGHLIQNLPAGSYVLHEVSDETDKRLAIAEDIPFTLDEHGALVQDGAGVSELIMYDSINTLTIRKEDQFKEAVDGAEITVTGPGYNKTITTAGGAAVFEDLVRGGEYTVRETKTPEGYAQAADATVRISEDGREYFIVRPGGTQEKLEGGLVMVDRRLLTGLKVKKTDASSGKELADAEFTLYRKGEAAGQGDTVLLEKLQMAQQGGDQPWIGFNLADAAESIGNPFTSKPLNRGLNKGTYYLTETKVPAGYKKAPPTEFEVTEDGTLKILTNDHAALDNGSMETIVIENVPLTLRIEKYDAETKEALTGAEYAVTGMFAGEAAETAYTLNEGAEEQDNVLSGKLLAGNVYKLEETKPPLGYTAAETAYFTIDERGKITVTDVTGTAADRQDIKAENKADDKNGLNGALQIYDTMIQVSFEKRSAENNISIDGAEFTVRGKFADGSDRKTLYPKAQRAAELKGQIIEGERYTLTEKEPAGYQPLTGTVAFTYTAEDGLKLEAGSDSSASAEKHSGGQKETLVIRNASAQNTTLQFIKYDAEDESCLPGTKFELTFTPASGGPIRTIPYTIPEAGTVYTYATAGAKHTKVTAAGEAFLTDLEPGAYVLREIEAVYAYSLGTEPFTCSFTVDDRSKNKTIVINKTNAETNAFDMTVEKGENLLTGKGIINERQYGSVTLTKTDALDHGIKLNGVGFTVYRYKESSGIFDKLKEFFTGKAYMQAAGASWTEAADTDGRLSINGLPWGEYYIVETSTLKDYVIDDTKYEFTIGKDKLTQVLEWTPGKEITNAKAQLTIGKITDDGKSAVGNQMRLYGKFANYEGEYIEWTVTDKPYVVAGELLDGEVYVLEEISPYDGCASAETVSFCYTAAGLEIVSGAEGVEITVDADGNIHLVQKALPIKVEIKKEDENKTLLSGASLKLLHKKTNGATEEIKTWTSGNKALKLEGVLSAGETYLLRETKAPAGYAAAADIMFTVQDTSEWQYVTMTDKKLEAAADAGSSNAGAASSANGNSSGDNKKASETAGFEALSGEKNTLAALPKTGREPVAFYYIFGGILILAGMLLCFPKCRKHKETKDPENTL